MPQVTANGRVLSVKMFDDDMRAEIKLHAGFQQTLTLKLTDNKQSAFGGMVALAAIAQQIPTASSSQLFVVYDDDDREISEMELR